MERLVDLHTHTTASDGTDTPSELVRAAVAAGLAAVAVTDHDTVAGLDEAEAAGAEAAGRGQAIEVIRGCELSTGSVCGELHILGLWLPRNVETLEAALKIARERRGMRNRLIVDKLTALGLPMDYDAVLAEAGGEAVGRPHIARAMVRRGHVPDARTAYDRYLRSGAPAFVPKETLSAPEAVRLLADLGATAALAHPLLVRAPRSELEACIVDLRAHGLTALEAFHADHSQADEAYVRALARRLGLCITGGSDYHGRLKPAVKLGRGRGGMRVGPDVLEALKQMRLDQGLPV
jgi:predicted metal-dependent phosphoesterase TrpH